MALVKIKGHEFNVITVKNSFNRKALQFKNKIITTLRAVGLTEDDVEINHEPVAMRKSQAIASWYLDGYYLHYSYQLANNYAENLFVVQKVIELKLLDLVNEEITFEEFLREFSEDHDIEDKRKEAREILGLDSDEHDLDVINKKYKALSKEYHPDMPNGNIDKFKKINNAHKILKRELA